MFLDLPLATLSVAWEDIKEYFTMDWKSALTYMLKDNLWACFGTVLVAAVIAAFGGVSYAIFENDTYTQDWWNHIFLFDMETMLNYFK